LVKGKPVNMNYINYEIAIVEKHKIELVGWPQGITFANPSAIGTVGDIRLLRTALIAGECKWIVQTKRQQAAHAEVLKEKRDTGEVIGKKRKQRSDKGKKRGRQDDGEVSGDERVQPKKRRVTGSKSAKSQLPPVYKSRDVIDNESDEED